MSITKEALEQGMANIEENSLAREGDHKEEGDTPYHSLATEYGWNPDGPKSAKEYILFALENLPKKNAALDSQNKTILDKDRKIAEMEVILNQLANDMTKQKELGYKQAETDLRMQRRDAIARGDVELVEQLDIAHENLKQEHVNNLNNNTEETKSNAYNQILIDNFREKNQAWVYGKTIDELEMQAYARQLENAMASQSMDLKEQLNALDQAVRKKYADYFTPEDTSGYSVEAVQPSNNTLSKKQKTYTFKDLDDAQKLACKYLVDKKTMTEEIYIKRLIENGDLK